LNKIIIASKNKGKISEIVNIMSIDGLVFTDLNELGFEEEIEENGSTFLENALIKAERIYKVYNIPVISDDSGLIVDWLNGKPGVYSARFAGEKATDEENSLLLLSKMKGIPFEKRSARFVCISVFYYGSQKYFSARGSIEGIIANSPAGNNGFGYDPIFFIPTYSITMAELSTAEKNKISHRANAFKVLKERYRKLFLR